jgi:hypothetical protein
MRPSSAGSLRETHQTETRLVGTLVRTVLAGDRQGRTLIGGQPGLREWNCCLDILVQCGEEFGVA